jgi:hypothetical protein
MCWGKEEGGEISTFAQHPRKTTLAQNTTNEEREEAGREGVLLFVRFAGS